MSGDPSEPAAREVLRCHWELADLGTLTALGNFGGFSGTRLWRLQVGREVLCLRAWPTGNPSPQRLDAIHRCMGAAAAFGLTFVPVLRPTRGGATWAEHAGRLWELATWMPGRADFRERPTATRLEAAVTALARLHLAWSGGGSAGRCPAVQRRLDLVRKWVGLLDSGWDPARIAAADDPARPWAERAWRLLPHRVASVPSRLAAWVEQRVPLQPCLCDIWHDHVLFVGDSVSGVIDFGSIKTDHVAVDLARLLGSMAGDDAELWRAGLREYARQRPLSAEEEALVVVLDETGTVLGAANWLRWLYHDGKQFEDRLAVARRLEELVRRLEQRG